MVVKRYKYLERYYLVCQKGTLEHSEFTQNNRNDLSEYAVNGTDYYFAKTITRAIELFLFRNSDVLDPLYFMLNLHEYDVVFIDRVGASSAYYNGMISLDMLPKDIFGCEKEAE